MSGGEPGATATGLHAKADLAPGTVLAGRFRIESLLGIGGMGVVYRALDDTLGVPVAVKLLRPELAARPEAFERFRQELLLARQVSNPHVVRIHDIGLHKGQWLISMDLVEGESLDHRLDRQPPGLDEALRITRQLAEGLQAAHAKGVIHRDLKPANVLLDAAGNAYISDFGVARSLATSGLTQSGSIVGTPDYLSPEQARGDKLDQRSDLYSLGLILYEMLAGRPAFSGSTVAEALAQRITRPPPPVDRYRSDLPRWVVRLLDRMLRPQPAHRLPDAAAVIRAIDTRKLPRDRRAVARVAIATVACLALVATGVAWWHYREHTPAPVTTSPPLHRVLVLAPAGPGVSPELSAALGDAVRDAIADAGIAVVDAGRSAQAIRQLDAAGGTPAPEMLQRIAAADRILRSRLLHDAGGWRVHGQLLPASGRPVAIDGPHAADAVSAVSAWTQAPGFARALGIHGAVRKLPLPATRDARLAYGRGLLARAEGKLEDALSAFRAATKASPDAARAWLAQAETAQLIGKDDEAYTAIEHGQRAAADGPARLQARFAAERAMLEGDPTQAAAAWNEQLQRTPDDSFAQLGLERARGAAGNFKAAVAGLQALARRDDGDPRVWYELGKFSILSGDARRAVDDYLVRALVLYKRGRDRYGEAETVNALGVGYGRLGQTADAEEQYGKAVELRRAVGNLHGVATSLGNLANIASMNGRFDQAAQNLAQARQINERLGDRAGLAAVDNELGLLAEERGDYPEALAAFRRALRGWQDIEDPRGQAQSLNDIGFAHFQLGDYDDARAYWQRASQAFAGLGDLTGQVRTRQNLGLLEIARGHWEQARHALTGALADAERQQMAEEAAVSRSDLAVLELEQGHLAAALSQAGKAEDMFREREDQRGLSDAGLLRVQALLAAHADRAAAQSLDALRTAIAESSAEQQAIEHLLRAELALRAGDRDKLHSEIAHASSLAERSGVRQLKLRAALLAARSGTGTGDDLDAATDRLGNAGLRLQWLEILMSRSLADGDRATALRAYREARGLLRGGDSQYGWRLHALGARALRADGQVASAADAQAAADAALAKLRAGMPEELRGGFDAWLQDERKHRAGDER